MKTIAQQIYECGVVPVVALNDANRAVDLGKALIKGGLSCIEVTFRTDAAEEAIKNLSHELPEMLIGAGTVLTTEQVDRAVAAGAKFIVTPGFNENVVKYCIEKGVTIMPGCNTPQAIERAMELGLTDLKFFPAEQSGGLDMIKALCAPYTAARFMPTGGINEKNLNDYLSYEKIIACGGTWMVKADLINEGRFDEIERLARGAVHAMLGFKLVHIGFNGVSEEQALKDAGVMSALFGMPVKPGNSSVFAGTEYEFMKMPYYGTHGHIAVGTNSVERAYAYLKKQGVEFLEDTIQYDERGRKKFVYLKDEVAGFAIHLIQNK